MSSEHSQRDRSPVAYRIATFLVAAAAVLQLFLSVFLFDTSVGASQTVSFLILGTLAFALVVHLSWARWLVLAAALLYVPLWIFTLSGFPLKADLHSALNTVFDGVRFGGVAIAAVLLWLPQVRAWYHRRSARPYESPGQTREG